MKTIPQAIEDLQARIAGEFCIKGQDDCADMQLGIEALKVIKKERESLFLYASALLPGETEE